MDIEPIVTQPGAGSNYMASEYNTNYSDWTTRGSDPPKDGVTIRTMTTADAAFVARCLITGFEAKVVHHIPKEKVEPLIGLISQSMANLQPNAQKRILIAEHCGKPAGIAMMRLDNIKESNPGDDDLPFCSVLGCCNVLRLSRNSCWKPTVPDRHLLLDVLAIMDGFRGKGIGKTLLVAVDTCARDAGLEAVCLWCAYENPALRLYLRHGYVEDQFINGHWRANCATGVNKWHYMVKRL